MKPSQNLIDLIFENEKQVAKSIRLVASENLPDIRDRVPYILDLYARYAFAGNHDETTGYFPQYNLREIEILTREIAAICLNAKYVNVRPISGMSCMLTAIAALTQKGDLVMSLAPHHGGHGETKGILKTLGLESKHLPFDTDRWQLDIESLRNLSDLPRVRLVYLDLCMVLFPQPIFELKKILPKKAKIVYDASHVLGLLSGGLFQDPLAEGADVLVGSTHKTLPGPHKGIIATNNYLLATKIDATSYHFTSHHHIADVACLGLVLERGRHFFQQYGKKIIENAQMMGKILSNRGIKVEFAKYNYTQTHQIWLDLGDLDNVNRVTKNLYEIDILLNSVSIPSLQGRWGIRIGTQEITHLGIKEEGLKELSHIIADVALEKFEFDIMQKRFLKLTKEGFTDFDKNKNALKIAQSIIKKD
ncbi:hypothetical protein [Candidatus Protochlamydia sp. W-9]|uniref:hypothetical protein n=1 Tax=Candidatus Protochlamydia sp. W-9 TaxID=1785087 RepID=UPI00096A413A|nr:hypothetical protein [Candidatus Protochlamydia sp. W-9]